MKPQVIFHIKGQHIVETDDRIRKATACEFLDFIHAVIDGVAVGEGEGRRLLQAVIVEEIRAQCREKMGMMSPVVIFQEQELLVAYFFQQGSIFGAEEQPVDAEFIKGKAVFSDSWQLPPLCRLPRRLRKVPAMSHGQHSGRHILEKSLRACWPQYP